MIFFKVLNVENVDSIIDGLIDSIEGCDTEYVEEIVGSMLGDDDFEYAFSAAYGCVLVRVFDGIYSFPYPIAVADDANPALAAWEIRAYAVRQEIPLVYTDVPREEIGRLVTMFRHANIDSADSYSETYTVKIPSEASIMPEIPTLSLGDVSLSPLTPEDDAEYARLCRDENLNKYWGYDYREDNPNPEDSYFREEAEGEFYRGISMTFAVRYNGRFVGEALLYGFDFMGGCDSAVRILPEYMKRGIATKALLRLKMLASDMGLSTFYATVEDENYASEALCDKCFRDVTLFEGRRRYIEIL